MKDGILVFISWATLACNTISQEWFGGIHSADKVPDFFLNIQLDDMLVFMNHFYKTLYRMAEPHLASVISVIFMRSMNYSNLVIGD